MTTSTKRRRKFFDCVPGTDGCDETFDLISRATGYHVASARFWDERVQARRAALDLTVALNKAFAGNRLDFNIAGLAREQGEIAIVYGVEQLRWDRPDLDDKQAWSVLERCYTLLDERLGTLVKSVAEQFFPSPTKGATTTNLVPFDSYEIHGVRQFGKGEEPILRASSR